MKHVVFLGDSILLWGYSKHIKEFLNEEEYSIFINEDNVRFSKYLLRTCFDLREELNKADLIHFNCGLWDATYLFSDGETFTSLKQYKKDLKRIIKILKGYCPKIIFSTTTPVDPKNPYHKQATISKFNKQISRILRKNGIIVNDLNKIIAEDIPNNISQEDYIHLTDKGSLIAAENISKIIIQTLKGD